MKCYNCRAEIENELKYCPRCGAEQGFSKELIEAAEKGDETAVADLYNRTYNSVYQSVRMLIKDEDTVLDIVQDAYIKGFQSLAQLKNPDSFRPWMKTIAVNLAKNYLVKKKAVLFSELIEDDEESGPEVKIADDDIDTRPELAVDQRETLRMIRQILDELPDEQRLLISLYYYEDKNAREIGEMLGINENTVRSRLKAAKKVVEEKILKLEEKEDIKLHSMLPIPFMVSMLHASSQLPLEIPNPQVLGAVQKTLAGGAKAGISLASKTAASDAAKSAGAGVAKAVSMKVIAVVTAAAVTIGGGAVAVHSHNSKATEKNPEVETPAALEQSLEQFAESQSTSSGKEYTGYLAMKDYQYEVNGQVYSGNGPGFDYSQIPDGWLDYQIEDLDGDGEDELIAVTAKEQAISFEIYEWDESAKEAVKATEFTPKRGDDVGYPKTDTFDLADADSGLSTFIFGEEEKYIGVLLWECSPPIADSYTMSSFAAVTYDGKEMKPACNSIYYDSAIRDEDMLKALIEKRKEAAEIFAGVGIPVTYEELTADEPIEGLNDLIAGKAENYQQIVKITSDWGEYRDEIHQWTEKAYGGENPKPLELSTIIVNGEHPSKK